MFNFGPKVPTITAEEVKQALDEKKNVIMLDVRTPDEFSRGTIAGSINIPVDEISNKIENVISDKNKTIYVYCLSGSRSAVAAQAMLKKGYTNVFSMTSGLLAWRAQKYTLTQ